jgi:hypothetical protein
MIGYLSMNGTNKMFNQWADADPNVNSYGFGQLYNQNGEPKVSQKYVGMWVQPISTTPEEYILIRNFQILIYDVTYDNVNLVISDCEEIALRLIRFLKNKSDIFNISGTPNIQPFTDRFLDDVSGVIIDLSIEFNGESAICDDPDYSFIIKSNMI